MAISHSRLYRLIKEDEFIHAPAGKWTAGQQLDHLVRAVHCRCNQACGTANIRKSKPTSKAYDELVKNTFEIAAGGKASGRFIPSQILPGENEKILKLVRK